MKIKKHTYAAVLFLLVSATGTAWATSPEGAPMKEFYDLLLYTLAGVAAVLLAITFYLYRLVRLIDKQVGKTAESEEFDKAFEAQGFWEKLFNLNPLSHEKKLLIDHAYDGIQELDNPTPPWFNFLFYGTIAFGLLYMVVYHVANSAKLQEAEYKEEMTIAEKAREEYLKKFANSINENNVKALTDAKGVADGKSIYDKYCVACHGAAGEGKVGPNLTDEYWLHGGGIKNVFHTITEGVPQKGMISWKKQLNPLQIQQVASYILTLQGTNPPNAKEPQGGKM